MTRSTWPPAKRPERMPLLIREEGKQLIDGRVVSVGGVVSITLRWMSRDGDANFSRLRSRRTGSVKVCWRDRRSADRSGCSGKVARVRRTQHYLPPRVGFEDDVRRRANDINAQATVAINNPVTARPVAGGCAILGRTSKFLLQRSSYRGGR